MENIRNIKEKIISCVSCNEDHCPIIKERLDRHIHSHHSTTRQASNLHLKYRNSFSRNVLTMTNSDEQTSTSDLIQDDRSNRTMHKKYIAETVREWAQGLPKFSNSSAENLKQNIINQLIEKINDLSSEASEEYYDLKLAMEIDRVIDSLRYMELENHEDDKLKELLIGQICELNKVIGNLRTSKTVLKVKDNNLEYKKVIDNETSTQDAPLSYLNLQKQYQKNELVGTQVEESFSNNDMYYGKVTKEPNVKIDKQQNTEVSENVYKQIIINWLDGVSRNLDSNWKLVVTDDVLSRLKRSLNNKSTLNHKLILKTEILNCLNHYADILLLAPENFTYLNRITEDLAVKLLSAKFNHEDIYALIHTSSYFTNSTDKIKTMNYESIDYFQPVVHNIVTEQLQHFHISELLQIHIINTILQNIKLICMRQDHYLEVHIFDILKHYTELSDYCISTLINSILDEIRVEATSNYLKIYNCAFFNDNFGTHKPSAVAVYKSEHELRGPNNTLGRRRSSGNRYQLLTTEEKTYVDNISRLIKHWMTNLPAYGSQIEKQKNKETIINNLSYDILDQAKLEQMVPETRAEKEKYLSFFIHRGLNRLNCLQNISDVQPYVENLIERLVSIPIPYIPENHTRSKILDDKETIPPMSLVTREPFKNDAQSNGQISDTAKTSKMEAILKEFLTKFIEHNHDEDNAITREVFGRILKSELQKLSTPTRKALYDNLNNKVDNALASEKFAKELQYINIISDWFKTLPLDLSFNARGNTNRAQYVNDLAEIINDVEESRLKSPVDMDYDRELKSRILQFTEVLPITKRYTNNKISTLADDLIDKIAVLRFAGPCCAFANEKDLSLNVSNLPDHNLSDFIEAYIRENSDKIEDDELKLDAWGVRIFKEVDNMASENPAALGKSDVYNRLAEISLQGEDLGKRFNIELSYAKEISNWLNNLPLQIIRDKSTKDLIVKMISNLAEKMSERWQIKNMDPKNTQVDVNLEDYMKTWITKLPLDRSKEIVLPVVIQQIWNRMERVNTGKQKPMLMQPNEPKHTGNMCESPKPCCNRHITKNLENRDPGTEIVEAIETWCNNLPIQSENNLRDCILKEELSTRLYKKICELNKNSELFNNNILYLQLLEDEIDLGLDNLPQNPILQNTREILKQQILDIVKENRNVMREKAAGGEYRQELENTIELSLPSPISMRQKNSSGFKIFKNALTQLFILENFDHGHDDFKVSCTRKLRNKIDDRFQDVQNMSAVTLIKDQILNELYNVLFRVPVPNETSIAEEVEEIKTRCEIESWFETLPIREAIGIDQLCERDQIISMLAKRFHTMEKSEKNPDDKIHKETCKWLMKLPLLTGQEQNIDNLANDLQHRLKLTLNDRKCKFRDRNKSLQEFIINKNRNKGVLGTSQVAGPSGAGQLSSSPTSSPSPEYHQRCYNQGRRPSDLLLNIVETWSKKLPIPENTQQEKDNAKTIRDNLVLRIIMKISELNVNSETFDNDLVYDAILDDELDDVISTLPNSPSSSKTDMKNQLKISINSIKPLIKMEKARDEYKQDLKNTADHVLEQPQNAPPERAALLVSLRDDIVDDFVAYSFSKDDKEDREIYKIMAQKAVERYYVETKETNKDSLPDPLTKGNELLSELAKVPAPNDIVISEEINEIRMKFELNAFFKELPITEDNTKLPLKNQLRNLLAKRLSDFSKDSLIKNHFKVKDEIIKCLKKIQNEIDPRKVDMFIERLEKPDGAGNPQLSIDNNKNASLQNQNMRNNLQVTDIEAGQFVDSENIEDPQWMSLLPTTPRVPDPNYHDTIEVREYRKSLGDVASPQAPGQGIDRNITQSEISYGKFKGGEALTSSVVRRDQATQSVPNSNDQYRVPVLNQSQSGSTGNKVPLSQRPTGQYTNQMAKVRAPNSSQQGLQSHNVQPDFMQEMRVGPNLQPPTSTPFQSQSPDFFSQQHALPQARQSLYPSNQNQPLSSQSTQQLRYMPSDSCRSQCSIASKYNFNSLNTVPKFNLENRDITQDPYRSPPAPKQISASSPKNICPGTLGFSPNSLPSYPQFSARRPLYANSRCNSSCRRPGIKILDPTYTDSNNLENLNRDQSNTMPLTSDGDESKCLCFNKRKRQCRGSPLCPAHVRKECRVCNRPAPFHCTPPYRYYYHY